MTRSFDVAYFIIISDVVIVFGSISAKLPIDPRVFPEFQGWQRLASNYRTIRASLPPSQVPNPLANLFVNVHFSRKRMKLEKSHSQVYPSLQCSTGANFSHMTTLPRLCAT